MILRIKSIFPKKEIFYFILWILILSAVNTNIDNLKLQLNKDFFDWIHSIRVYIQFIILPFLIYKNFKDLNSLTSINKFFVLFLLYNIVQLTSLFLTENNNLNFIYNLFAINVLLFLNIIFNKKDLGEIKNYFYIFIFIILLIYTFFYIEKIYLLIMKNYLFYGHYEKSSILLPTITSPRSSGIGRMALILFAFFLIFYNKKINFRLNIFLALIIVPGIILTQSRTIVFIFLLIVLIISFGKHIRLKSIQRNNFKQNFLYYLILPIIFSLLLSQLKQSNLNYLLFLFENKNQIINSEIDLKKYNEELNSETEYKIFRAVDPNTFSSNRVSNWTKLFQAGKNKIIFGYGTQSDRYLVKESASNSIVYFYSSSGLFGVFLYFLIMVKLLKIFYKKYFLLNSYTCDNFLLFSFTVISIILLRSLTESSFAIFGIDYIFFIISLYFVNYEKKS